MEAISINKQQYLAELEKLLGFMSSWDREAQMKKYAALFENCKDDQELIDIIGTPTKIAIGIARNYTPSPEPEPAPEPEETEIPAQEETEEEEVTSPVENEENPSEAEEVVVGAVFDKDNAVDDESRQALGMDDASEEADSGEIEDNGEDIIVEITEDEEEAPVAPAVPEEPAAPKKTKKVRVIPTILYTIIAIAIGVPVAVVLFAISLVFAALGVALIGAAVMTVKSIVLTIVMVSDILILCGSSLIVAAIGLVILWFGIWLCVTMITGWIGTCIFGLGRKICIKEVG